VGGAVASWLVCSSLEWAVQVQALARNTVLCSWARRLTLTVPLSTQEYKWVLANCWGNLTNWGGVTCDGLASRPGGVEILLAASCYSNWDELQQLWAIGCKASLFFSFNVYLFLISEKKMQITSGHHAGTTSLTQCHIPKSSGLGENYLSWLISIHVIVIIESPEAQKWVG